MSTNVGGIPEVLPCDGEMPIITLAKPEVDDLIDKLEIQILKIKQNKRMDPFEMHEKVKHFYNWRDIAKRTTIVYDKISHYPNRNLMERLKRLIISSFLELK